MNASAKTNKLPNKQKTVLPPPPKRMFQQDNNATGQAVCSVHGHYTPFFLSHPICPQCAVLEVERQNAAHEKKLFEQREAARFVAACFPQRHMESGFKNYEQNLAGQQYALSQAIKFASWLQSGKQGCLVLSGTTGTGKTHLAVSIAKNVMARVNHREPLFARFAYSKDIAEDILGAYKRDGDSERAAIRRYVEPDLLIVDDYGLDDQRESQVQAVHKILYARYDDEKSTILTSNFLPAVLAAKLGDRLWSRLSENGGVIECKWADQRSNKNSWAQAE